MLWPWQGFPMCIIFLPWVSHHCHCGILFAPYLASGWAWDNDIFRQRTSWSLSTFDLVRTYSFTIYTHQCTICILSPHGVTSRVLVPRCAASCGCPRISFNHQIIWSTYQLLLRIRWVNSFGDFSYPGPPFSFSHTGISDVWLDPFMWFRGTRCTCFLVPWCKYIWWCLWPDF